MSDSDFFEWAWSRIREAAPDLPEHDPTVELSIGPAIPDFGYEAHLSWPDRGVSATGVGATIYEAVENVVRALA